MIRGVARSWCLCSAPGGAAVAGAQPLAASGEGRVLVTPFDGVSRDNPRCWLREACALHLSDRLGAHGVDVTMRDERVRAFDELQLPARASLSLATIGRVGELVGAAETVIGTVTLDGARLVVKVRSIRLDAGRLRPEVVEQGPLQDMGATFDRLAGHLAGTDVPAGSRDQGRPPLPAGQGRSDGTDGGAVCSRARSGPGSGEGAA
jgi:hypothetical protein